MVHFQYVKPRNRTLKTARMVTCMTRAFTTTKITAVLVHLAKRTTSWVSQALCGDGPGGSLRQVQPLARGCTASAGPGWGASGPLQAAGARGGPVARGAAYVRVSGTVWLQRALASAAGQPERGPRGPIKCPTGRWGRGKTRWRRGQRRDPKDRIGCWGRGRGHLSS